MKEFIRQNLNSEINSQYCALVGGHILILEDLPRTNEERQNEFELFEASNFNF